MNNKLGLFLKDSDNVGMRKGTVALLALHDALGLYFANTISGNEDQFKEILNRAHYFATQTQIDPDAFSDEYKPTLVKLLMLTKQAYNYFKIKEHGNKYAYAYDLSKYYRRFLFLNYQTKSRTNVAFFLKLSNLLCK